MLGESTAPSPVVRDGENIYWWGIFVISRRYTPYEFISKRSPVYILMLGDGLGRAVKLLIMPLEMFRSP